MIPAEPLANPSDETVIATYEDDENRVTRLLRALFVLFAGGLLLWAQWRAPFEPIGQFWNRWIWTSVVFNFVMPLGIVWLFFGQGLSYHGWLRDQRNNAWSYGFGWFQVPYDLSEDEFPVAKIGRFTFAKTWHPAFWNAERFGKRAWKRYALTAVILWAAMLPLLWFFSRDPSIRADYAAYLPPVSGVVDWLWLFATLVIYMWCWEWFFRGFALFGLAQGLGPWLAILIQAGAFGLTHIGKPPIEMASAFAGGAILGVLCWREKSFVPAFLTHSLIHLTWAVLVLS